MALEDCGSGSTTKIKGIKNSTKRESLFFMRFKRVKIYVKYQPLMTRYRKQNEM